MKRCLIIIIIIICSLKNWAQTPNPFYRALQIKVDPLELAYDFSRIGIGLEKKFITSSAWASLHYGTNLDQAQLRDSPDGHFTYYEIQLGAKRIYSTSFGEYFFGGHVGFDKAKRYVDEDVYYDIDGKFAVLYDNAYYFRTRLSLFIENGYEFYIGNRFSIELSTGIGIRSIQNSYDYVTNPFQLNDVEPRHYRSKTQYKYVGQWIKPALIGAVKFGYRISG